MMKTLMFALLGLTPNLVAWNYAVAQTGDATTPMPTPQVIVVRNAGEAEAQPGNFEWVSADGQQHIQIVAQAEANGDGEQNSDVQVIQLVGGPGGCTGDVVVTADAQVTGDPGSGQKVKQIKVIAKPKADDPDAAQRGWLGVSIESVPESMSAQLGGQKRGVMVGNVVTGSPADTAGIQAHDIITAINGEEVPGDVGPAVDLIKTRKPGETINVGIFRAGQAMTLKTTLGSRANMKGMEWKFDMPGAQVDEQIKTRGKFMLRGPNGELTIKDLGELEDLKNLPENIRMMIPQSGTRSTQVFVANGQKTIKMNVEKDGSSVSIEQVDGGQITVRRTDDDGKETVATYDNEDDLKAGDADAYELYSQAGQSVFVHVDGDEDDGDGPHIFIQGDGGFNWSTGDAGQWKAHLEESLSQAKEAYSEAMQELHNNLMALNKEGKLDVNKFHEWLSAQGGNGMGQAFAFHAGKPTHRFNANADGSIEVSIRKGDSELSQSFKNEADMAKRRPDLYEKYQDVKSADNE